MAEVFQKLLTGKRFKLERIVSTGQATPPGEWYDQDRAEWVVLLSGAAKIRFEGARPRSLKPGDFVLIPAHRRHRVEWTHPRKKTVWLALHYVH
jgi:cupin 2 domain-containing protein